jgi:hypothetical protein
VRCPAAPGEAKKNPIRPKKPDFAGAWRPITRAAFMLAVAILANCLAI